MKIAMPKQVDGSQGRRALLCALLIIEITLLNGLISNALSYEGARPFLPLLNLVGYKFPSILDPYPDVPWENKIEIYIKRAATGEITLLRLPVTWDGLETLILAHVYGDRESAKKIMAEYLLAGDEIDHITLFRSGPRPLK